MADQGERRGDLRWEAPLWDEAEVKTLGYWLLKFGLVAGFALGVLLTVAVVMSL